ncbi:MAG: iron-sulfur cluster-binding domain-containing protein, partial [Bacteroidota bacterium]
GITPLMSILKGILYHEPYSRVTLIYANKTERDIIFRQELDHLHDVFPERLQVVHFLSREPQSSRVDIHIGRIEAIDKLYRELQGTSALPETHFLCGPKQLMRSLRSQLLTLQVPEACIKQEDFQADEAMQMIQAAADGPTYQVKVHWAGEVHQVRVPPGQTLLDAAITQGLDLPYSCKRGTCSTCMGRLKAGKAEMVNPAALLDFEIELGKILVCQTIPLSEDLEVVVGT